MPTNMFNATTSTYKAPSYCGYNPWPVPPILPGTDPPLLNGYARWTDLDPLGPVDIAMYTRMVKQPAPGFWIGDATKGATRLMLTLSRVVGDNIYRLVIRVWPPELPMGITTFDDFTMQLEPSWDTGLHQHIFVPGLDFQEARVTQ